MLKIQKPRTGQTILALIGRMQPEEMLELSRLVAAEPSEERIVLDLKDLVLAGQNEVDFFARCEERGHTLVNCPPYIREWITRRRTDK